MNPEAPSIHLRDDWDRHWSEYAAAAERNPAQRFRRKVVLSCLALKKSAALTRLLDIGSGQGDFAAEVLEAYPAIEVLGLELSSAGVEMASRKVPAAQFLQCDLAQSNQPAEHRMAWATHAVCSEVLEHVDDPETLLRHARAWMAPGCRLVVTVPGGPMSAFDRHIGHRQHFRPEELARVLQRAGFVIERTGGAGWPFFNLYRRVVIARGRRLIDDVSREPSPVSRAAMGTFDALFHLNVQSRGWQTFAVATCPE